MAAPIYDTAPNSSHDLTDINLCEASTNFSQYTSSGGNLAIGAGTDFSMQGTNGVDAKITNNEKGYAYDNGTGITFGTGDHLFMWIFLATPGLSDTLALRGLTVAVGTGTTAWVKYHVEGNNTYGAAGRVGKCYVVDYSVRTSNTGSIPYRTINGTAGANPQYFGASANITAAVKSNNIAIDAFRYGTGAYLYNGESADPCTFSGFATVNDNSTYRWGILTGIGGTNYELQGKFVIGQNNAGTATLAYFDDSDINISVVDTVHSATDFSEFIIDHASTTCNWTNINITALGTNNPGKITVTSNDPTFDVVGGTFTGIGTTVLDSNSTIDGTTWRSCDTVTQGGSTIDAAIFETTASTTAALVADNANLVGATSACTFVGDGTTTPGHAVDLGSVTGGTVGSPTVITWYNELDNGANQATWAGSTQASTGGTQGTANDAVLINVAAGTYVKISVASGASIPTVQNTGTGNLEITANEVTLTITVKDIDTGSAIQDAMVYVTNSGETATYINKVETDVNGQVSHTTSLGSAQTLAGNVRAASPATKTYTKYYKTGTVAGTFSNTADTDITIQLIPDE
ncbi:MAG: hypothetical protein KJO69_06445 [Gammaproteobacteria bacterium]|nr:hypothetical protein [Gammaproteobacteria bacterium]